MKRQIVLILREKKDIQNDKNNNQDFTIHYQQSILLTLLEQKKLTQWQFDKCIELLNK